MYLIKGHIISSLYFALSTSSFTLLFLLNVLYSCTLSGSGKKKKKKKKSNQLTVSTLVVNCISGVMSLTLDKPVIFGTSWTRLKRSYAKQGVIKNPYCIVDSLML